ncbi:MAG: beta-galactosidase trimerization domain-containing protein [Verrucomicrobia bacterium]|nr:beta-galactosidase trimerization domain-containing protein [Verrucomicrobiota bacterium]MBU4429227.1 beta-galactosidase trimerization domain-containing protein [Verrucomicrobiota bacterium]
MHISDWDKRFMSKFDPKAYAELIELGHIDTTYIYAGSCLGNCYWPTEVGHMHDGLKGMDILGETIKECNKRGIRVVVYFNIWSLWAYQAHPDWRIVAPSGKGTADYLWTPGHYGVLCPNSPYRDYVVTQIEDICRRYEFVGMWFDMNFWPYTVCYCHHCANRWAEEVGGPLPRTIDWNDPKWLDFQRKREEWLAEFTMLLTNTAKRAKPGISVCHQSGLCVGNWTTGPSQDFFKAVDYMGGDFYKGFVEQSFICRMLYNLSRNLPYDYMESRCPDLSEHTTAQEHERIYTHFCLTLAHNGANFLIDAIDPEGTLDRRVYERLGKIYRDLERYEKYLDPNSRLCQDVVIYFNFNSLYDTSNNGKPVADQITELSQIAVISNLARMLLHSHVPYGVITDKNLGQFSQFKVIVLPDFVILSEIEAKAIADFVKAGGGLYVSKGSGIFKSNRYPKASRIMADVLGIEIEGETIESISYIAPNDNGKNLLCDHTPAYPMAVHSAQLKIKAVGQAQVLATTTLPCNDPADQAKFASAISNPPGKSTDNPAIVINSYGNGKAIFVAGAIDHAKHEQQRQAFVRMVGAVLPASYNLQTDAPRVVEATAAYHDGGKVGPGIVTRCVVNLVNCPDVLPAVPVTKITVRIKPETMGNIKVMKLPEEQVVGHTIEGEYVVFTATNLEVFGMYAIDTLQ